jgi:hypothetical protein
MKFLNHNLFTGDITVNGTTTLSTATGVTRATGDNSTHLATTAFVKAQGYATTAALSGYVPTSRTLTINGTTFDLSANRSWTISGSDGYISNVQLVDSILSFTGIGSAFSGIVDLSTLTPTVRTVYETVKNVSGATILKGTPLAVVAGQTSGNVSDVVPANAADPTKMPAVFIANENILDQAEGEAVLFGNLTGVDTSAYTSGTTVYVAPGGGWTATKPVWPNLIQNLGVITKQHATNGAGIVTGVGRANALPNLTAGKIWVGSATYPIESTTVHVDEANARVGIGTTSPNRKLHVSTGNTDVAARLENTTSNGSVLELYSSGDGRLMTLQTDHIYLNAGALHFGAENGALYLRSSGYGTVIGGTTVYSTGGSAALSVIGDVISFGASNGDLSYFRRLGAGKFQWQTYNSGNTGEIHLQPYGGNVGVSTILPAEKFHVVGNVRIDGGSTAAVLETNDATAAEAGTTYKTFTTADHYAVFVDYVVYDAGRANMRTGTFRAVWSTGDVVYTDVSTVDLGATDNVTLTAAISGANVNLIVTGPADYTLKYNLKVIK